jgi:cation-transporting ATPase 13A1
VCASVPPPPPPPPPPHHARFVLRTGFATEQGNLLRTIIGNTGRVSANNIEMFIFILFLLTFAIAASSYVFLARVGNTKKLHKLIVECLLIITAVVPPELPVQLNLAVNNALLKLREKAITCTEPFRIPFAGKLDVCCFDKTGTLTEGAIVVNGVAGLGDSGGGGGCKASALVPLSALSTEFPKVARVLAACHALAHVQNNVVGDPLERATINALGWQYTANGVASATPAPKAKRQSVRLLKRFYFSSSLKRMSTVGVVSDGDSHTVVAFCKGAPETLKTMFARFPPDYNEVYEHHARLGARVLALGCALPCLFVLGGPGVVVNVDHAEILRV